MSEFDAKSEVNRLKAVQKSKRKKPYATSRLDKYRGELVQLIDEGATPVHLQTWLRERRIKVVLSTITRYLDKHELR